MRMPFERLMEHVAALSKDDEIPMGSLAERWGEPVQRVADAITAVRVMNWERTYVTVQVPAGEPCRGFRWIGQSFASCDRCGHPAWDHIGEERVRPGAALFAPDAMEFRAWKPGEAEAIRLKWGR
jgi:hypothetical protein